MENLKQNQAELSASELLQESIKSYLASHAKCYKSVKLAGDTLTGEVVAKHAYYAQPNSNEKPLMAVGIANFVTKYFNLHGTLLVTDRFLYYKLVNAAGSLFPMVKWFTKRSTGIIPLSSIKEFRIGTDIMTLDGNYFGHEVIVNGSVLGLVTFGGLNRDGAAEEVNQILSRVF